MKRSIAPTPKLRPQDESKMKILMTEGEKRVNLTRYKMG